MKYYIFIIVFFLLLVQQVDAQKVGLVLSGGGAPGIAHIGMIKALEENSIPIDYITGTSIGAFIGALYASGYSPDEMIQFFKSSDFRKLKRFEIRFPKKFFIPTHIIQPQKIQKGLEKLTGQATKRSGADFDSLFVPFRCVASDVYHKESFVFRRGNLATAIRASMTFPFVFEATKVDNRLLFDGGIYNNFPADIMQESFHPDFIIGSVVAYNPPQADSNDILMQLQNMIISNTNYNIPDSLGIVLNFDLKKRSMFDFSQIDSLVNIGYLETKKQIEGIKMKVQGRVSMDEINRKRVLFRNSPL
ncbi:MAG: patatin-like phospholipase family protein [Paludibacter sp.]